MNTNAGLALLVLAYRGPLDAPDTEAGIARICALLAHRWDSDTVRTAHFEQAQAGLLREPLQLSEQSLHCSWRLQLTVAGRDAVRALMAERGMTHDALLDHLRSET